MGFDLSCTRVFGFIPHNCPKHQLHVWYVNFYIFLPVVNSIAAFFLFVCFLFMDAKIKVSPPYSRPLVLFEPHHEKTCLRGFCPGKTPTSPQLKLARDLKFWV